MAASNLNVGDFIDEQPFGRYQALVIGLCVLVVIVEGFDAQAMGYVAPVVSKQLHIARAALGPVLSSGLIGMMIGALTLGPLGDRIGRKPVILSSVLLVGIGSLLTATADSVGLLLTFRLLTGVGLGGSLPNLIALNSEYTPRRLRATAIVIAGCGFSMGATFGGFASAGLLARFGWRSVFVFGGILPCIVAGLIFARMPESIRFLLMRGSERDRVARTLSRIAPGVPFGFGTLMSVEQPEAASISQLFTAGRAKLTIALWVMFFMNLLDVYFLNNWLPTVMPDAGIALQNAILITSMFQAGGTAGALMLGWLIDRALSYRVLAWAFLAAGVCVLLIGSAGASTLLLACTVFAAGFCIVGGQIGSNALAADSYPTALRSTGVGWTLGVGRLGSIIGPLAGGALLSAQGGVPRIFMFAAGPIVIASLAAFVAANSHVSEKKHARVAVAD
jgi:AAHS family 4-hydroxybenzoate transporter-like MFS transporter